MQGAIFEEPISVVVSHVPTLRLAESAGLYDLLAGLGVRSPNAIAKATSVIGGMLAGADSIADLDLLRHGGMPRLFGGVRAPSTLGTFLRGFTHGHVQQVDSAGGRVLAGLCAGVPGLLAGAEEADGWRSSMSMARSVRFMVTPSRGPRSATPGSAA